MNITHMQYFIKLAECGSLSRAAEALFISHQGLSKIIGSMEDELGCKLVDRGHAGVSLTDDGATFLEYAHDITRRYADLADELAARRDSHLRIGGAPVRLTATYYVMQVDLMGLMQESPRLFDSATIRETALRDIPGELQRAKQDDLFLVHLFDDNHASVTADGSYVFDELATTTIGALWKDKDDLRGLAAASPEQVARHPLACASDGALNEQLARIFGDDVMDGIYLKSSRNIMLVDWARKGRVVSLFDSFAYELAMREDRFRRMGLSFTPIDGPRAVVHVGFLSLAGAAPGERARALAGDIKQAFLNRPR